ncbi:MAG: RNA-binding S4 domain-containing protein [Alphaproteobacteria bacterium]|nr:RNA-binding S4 domain-containing protein [Alphaproteobacteria bacterium]
MSDRASDTSPKENPGSVQKGRLDKWLWHARFFKTRTRAAEVIAGGHVRVNRQPVRKTSHSVGAGDVLTFLQEKDVRVIEIQAIADRRGPASEAQTLYKDLAPPQPHSKTDDPAPVALRGDGAGRPTKKERRDTDRLRGQGDL